MKKAWYRFVFLTILISAINISVNPTWFVENILINTLINMGLTLFFLIMATFVWELLDQECQESEKP